jgi:cytoskeleton protein RodZ
MTDPNHAEETVAPVPASSGAGPGVLIRRARERAMMSQDELAAQLRLSRATLDALEHDDFAALSEPVYIRGYYRKCAKFLDLSEAELLSAYDRVAVRRAPPAPTKLLLAGSGDGGRSGIDMRLVSWGVGIAVVVAIGVFALHKRSDLSATSVEQPTTTTRSAPVPANSTAASVPAPAEPPASAVPSSREAAVPAAAPHAGLSSSTPVPVSIAAPAHVSAASAAAEFAASESPANSTAAHVLTSVPAPSQAAKTAPHVAALAPPSIVAEPPTQSAAAPHAAASASTPELISPQAPKAAPHAASVSVPVSVPAPMPAVTPSRVAPELPAKPAAVIHASASAPGSAPAAAPSQPETSALELRHHNAAPSGNDRNGPTAVAVVAPPKPEASKTETSSSTSASKATLPLEVSIHETSWVHIEDANGKLLLSRMMHPGDTQRVLGVAPYSVFVGYAPGVDLHYGDASVDLQPYSRDNSTARLKVPLEKFH